MDDIQELKKKIPELIQQCNFDTNLCRWSFIVTIPVGNCSVLYTATVTRKLTPNFFPQAVTLFLIILSHIQSGFDNSLSLSTKTFLISYFIGLDMIGFV